MQAAAKLGLFGPHAQARTKAAVFRLPADPSKNYPKVTTSNYLEILASWREGLTGEHSDAIDNPEGFKRWSEETARLWPSLRSARIFDLSVEAYSQAHHFADRYTTEVLAGIPWVGPGEAPLPDGHTDAMTGMYMGTMNDEWWFDSLPFDTCYLGFGHGASLSNVSLSIRGDRYSEANTAEVIGLLISDSDKSVVEISLFQVPSSPTLIVGHYPLCVDGVWGNSMTLGRWLVPMLVDMINENKSLITEKKPSFGERRDFTKAGKKMKVRHFFPRPYYTVSLRKKVIDDSLKKSAKARIRKDRIMSYRHDVRGHECVKVLRGPLPLSEKDEANLLKRGYRIYEQGRFISEEDFARLMARGGDLLRKGEWLAVFSWWRESHVRGPEDAPYVPAVRTLG